MQTSSQNQNGQFYTKILSCLAACNNINCPAYQHYLHAFCSCGPVCYLGTLFWDDITKFWDENLILLTFLTRKLRRNLL